MDMTPCRICGSDHWSSTGDPLCGSCREPGEARLCTRCSKPYKAPARETTICRSCWQADQQAAAEGEHQELRAALASHGLVSEVWHTGGGVYCVTLVWEHAHLFVASDVEEQGACLCWGDGEYVNIDTGPARPVAEYAALVAALVADLRLDRELPDVESGDTLRCSLTSAGCRTWIEGRQHASR